jgi:hypothetical protein
MDISEMKELVKEAASWAKSASDMSGENITAASLSAQISIAKSLTVIAGILERVTNGDRSINTFDMHPEI